MAADVLKLLQDLSEAAADAQAKEQAANAAHQKALKTVADAKAQYDAIEQKAMAEYKVANDAYQDALVAGKRIRDQVAEALGGPGGVFADNPRVRMG
jgi:hypothetical protein